MLLIACVLLLAILALFLMRFVMYRDYRIFRLYQIIKQRIFYNAIFRYIIQSSLKLQIAAMDTIIAEYLISSASQVQIAYGKIVFPILIIGTMTLVPFLFVYILRANRPNLPYLPMQRRFGTLYLGLNSQEAQVEWYTFSFMLRRSFFVILTYSMMAFPGIQVQIFCFMTVIYIIFANHMRYYSNRLMIDLENFNESFLLVLSYHFVLFCNLLTGEDTKK